MKKNVWVNLKKRKRKSKFDDSCITIIFTKDIENQNLIKGKFSITISVDQNKLISIIKDKINLNFIIQYFSKKYFTLKLGEKNEVSDMSEFLDLYSSITILKEELN